MAVNKPDFSGGRVGRIYTDVDGSFASNTAQGGDGDIAISLTDNGTGNIQRVVLQEKTSGIWQQGITPINGTRVQLPYRSLSMGSSDLLPGWTLYFLDSWATNATVNGDLFRDGTFGGPWYSSVSGTNAGFQRNRGGNPLPFFSGRFQITALPEASRFFHFGQFVNSSTNIYGYGLRIESTGALTLRMIDGGTNTALATGMTVAVNDTIVLERFGWRMTVYKTTGVGRTLNNSDAAAASRPLSAQLRSNEGFATYFAASSFGLVTDSNSVRVNNVEFVG
jgi:hypothetical protein